MKISYPEGFAIESVEQVKAGLASTTFQKGGDKTSNPYSVMFYCENPDSTDGDIFKITFNVPQNLEVKKYDFELIVETAYDGDYSEIERTVTNGSVTVKGKDFDTLSLTGIENPITYDGQAHNVSVSGIDDIEGAEVKWSYTNTEGGTYTDVDAPSFTSAGTYYIKAVVSAPGYNDPEDPVEGTLVITPKEVSVTVPAVVDKTYDGETAEDEIKAALKGATVEDVVTGDTVNVSFQDWTVTDVDAGDHSVTIGVSIDNPNYKVKTEKVTVDYKINPCVIDIIVNNATKVVGMDVPTLSWKMVDDTRPTYGATVKGELTVTIPEDGDYTGARYDIDDSGLYIDATNPDNFTLRIAQHGQLNIVANIPSKVEVSDSMTKTTYYEGETLIPAGITVTAYYSNGDTVNVALENCVFTPSVMPEVDADTTKTVTIEYQGVKATKEDGSDWSQEVTVKDNPIVSITVDDTNAKHVYTVKDTEVSKEGLVVTATYKDEEANTALKGSRELGADEYGLYCDLATAGDDIEVTVELVEDHDIRGSYTITVINRKLLADLKVVDTNDELSLIEGQTFNLEGSGVKVYALFETYTDAAEKEKDITNQFYKTVENITLNKEGSVEIPLEYKYSYGHYYEDASCKLKVAFAAKSVTGIEVLNKDSDSIKTAYYEGDTFDPTGVKIKLYYNNGSDETITEKYSEHGISFSPATLTEETTIVTVSAGDYSDKITVTVEPVEVTGIKITKINKGTYVDGESFSKDDIVVTAYYNNGNSEETKDYTVSHEIFTLTDKTVEETIKFIVYYTEDPARSSYASFTIVPCVAIIGEDRYADLDEAIDAADEGDTIELPLAGEYDVDVDKELTFENTSGEDITITINDEEVTIADGETYEVEIEEEEEEKPETDTTYFAFYLQMLQWRNRTFLVSYKQTEGGTISGANSARFSQSVTFTVTPNEGYEIADVTVNGKSVGAVETYTIKNIKANTTVSASFNKIETETVEVEIVPDTTVWVNPFTDVAETDAFYAAVQYVYENGLFKGMSSTEFAPATTMNRAMFVTVLGRLTGVNVDDYTTVTFSDCEAGSWYAPYVEWAAKAGIVKGMSATEFAPDAEITVEQAVTILYRYMTTMGYDLTGAADLTAYADGADVADWAAEAMQWAVANNIYVADTLAPQTAAARSLVATMLYNLSNLLVK